MAWNGPAAGPDAGFRFSDGPDGHYSHKGLARYVDRILRCAKPAELPMELPKTVEFVINLKTAKTLGIRVPQSVLLPADRVIE